MPFSAQEIVQLDPAVELLLRPGGEGAVLCHHGLEMGMLIPEGEGLHELVGDLLGAGLPIAELLGAYDDEALVSELLSALHLNGFLLVSACAEPSASQLAEMQSEARLARCDAARPVLRIDLDCDPTPDLVGIPARGFDIELSCRRLADQAVALARLAALVGAGRALPVSVTLVAAEVRADEAIRQDLIDLNALVICTAPVSPSTTEGPDGLSELLAGMIPVIATMRPGRAFFSEEFLDSAAAWATANRVGGLRVDLDPDELFSDREPSEKDCIAVFERVARLAEAVGMVTIAGMPADTVLCGASQPRTLSKARSPAAQKMRQAYLRWKLPRLAELASSNVWSQTPNAERRFVRPDQDLLPTHPELLGLAEGSVLLDVCGGIGRVARRLAPAVGQTGRIISVEMIPLLVDRARCHAASLGIRNIQFREGLAQRIPLPDSSVDAAINEWTGAVWELDLGGAMLAEMARTVKPGGFVCVTHRLVQLDLAQLDQPWVQYPEIVGQVRAGFDQAGLPIVSERIWGQIVPSLDRERAADWYERYLVPVIDPLAYDIRANPYSNKADVYISVIAQQPGDILKHPQS
jgi:ubiquinone/menaquinone biosynthesis C-methylase UbiE